MPFNLGIGEMLVLAVVAIIIFGGRLPDVARRVGGVIHQFRSGVNDEIRKVDVSPDISPRKWVPPEKSDDAEAEPKKEEPETE